MPARRPLVAVANGDWGATSLRAVHAVLHSAAFVLCDAFGRVPNAPVRVHPGDGPPMVARDRRRYWIRVAARDTYWCQYAYQFSRELCRALANFDRIGRHRHKWFEESLCEVAALFALHRLSERFRHDPPSDVLGATDFAPHFTAYADEIANRAPPLPPGGLAAWFCEKLPALEQNHADRDLHLTAATAMLNAFLDDGSRWRDCGSMNLWDAALDRSFAGYLASWAAQIGCEGRTARTPGGWCGSCLGWRGGGSPCRPTPSNCRRDHGHVSTNTDPAPVSGLPDHSPIGHCGWARSRGGTTASLVIVGSAARRRRHSATRSAWMPIARAAALSMTCRAARLGTRMLRSWASDHLG